MIVVSNTSPLTSLAAIRQFDLLQSLFGEIHVAESVINELSAGEISWPGAKEVEKANWVRRHEVSNRLVVDALRLDLDMGEAETIALALDLRADLVLSDEQAGRHAAQYFNLAVMGTVGLLIRAKKLGLITEVRSQLDALRQQAGFYLSQPVYQHALWLAGE